MSNVAAWSVTAGLNTSSPPDGWPEGMQRSAVNDAAREMQAALARWFKDSTGSLVSAGGPTAYTLTTNCGYTSANDIPLLAFRINVTNTGAVTLNVDGLGAKPWRKTGGAGEQYAAGELVATQLVVVAHNPADDDFYTVGPQARSEFAATTSMLFWQAAAPTGWTKYTAAGYHDRALRLVATTGGGGVGGNWDFSAMFQDQTDGSGWISNHALTLAQIPAHVHNAGTLVVGTAISNGTLVNRNSSAATALYDAPGGASAVQSVSLPSSTIALASGVVSGVTDSQGSSGGHQHAVALAVKYTDIIAASKD